MISLLVIGNEILAAQVEDTNLRHMLIHLGKAGYRVDQIRVVPDKIEVIAAAVRDLSVHSQYVISCGGVGPTHDDVTLAAYALAFEVPMNPHPGMVQRLRAHYGERLKEGHLRMTHLPANVELLDVGAFHWPVFKIANCFVLPGLPEIFVKKFAGVLQVLPPAPTRWFAALATSLPESEFAAELSALQDRFPLVEIGSYPKLDCRDYAVRVTLKAEDRGALEAAFAELHGLFAGRNGLVGEMAARPYDPESLPRD